MSISNITKPNIHDLYCKDLTTTGTTTLGSTLNVAEIDTGAATDLSIKRNGIELLALKNDGSDYLDFKNVEVRNLTTSLVTELGSDLVIGDSLEIGSGSNFKLSSSGAGNGTINVNDVPSTDQLLLQIGGTSILALQDDKVYSNQEIRLSGLLDSDRRLYGSNSNYIQMDDDTNGDISFETANEIHLNNNLNNILTVGASSIDCDQPIVMTNATSSLARVGTSTQYMEPSSTGLKFVVPTGDYILHNINGTNHQQIYANQVINTWTNGAITTLNSSSVDFYEGGTGNTITMEPRTDVTNTGSAIQMKYDYTGTEYNGVRLLSEMGGIATRGAGSFRMENYHSGDATWRTFFFFDGDGSQTTLATKSRSTAIHLQDTICDFNIDVEVASGYSLTMISDLAYKASTSTWSISSDARLKENVEDVSTKSSLDAICKIKVRNFDYIKDFKDKYNLGNHKKIGVIAQELEAIPEFACCVDTRTDEVFYDEVEEPYFVEVDAEKDEDGNVVKPAYKKETMKKKKVERYRIKDRKQVNVDRINYHLIAAVQQLTKQNVYMMKKLKEVQDVQKEMFAKLHDLEASHELETGRDVFESASYSATDVQDNTSMIG